MFVQYFFLSLALSIIATLCVRIIMRRFGVVDKPEVQKRKIHKKVVPLGGGFGIFFSFFLVVLILVFQGNIGEGVSHHYLLGLFLGSLVIMVGGVIDDKYNLRARYQIWFPIVAAVLIIAFGIGPHVITNPLGGDFFLGYWKINFFGIGNWVILADVVVFFWLMGMMFTTKFLDGLDGLVAGVVAIGAFMIYFLSLQAQWYQPDVALLAIVFAGSCLGFLIWNWHPAKIFLGEGGSLFTGFVLGTLAIISGGKIATTLLVVGVPMLDVIRVVIRRIQKKKPVYEGDTEHLHFKLLNSGLSQKQAVLLFYTISLLFGITALFLQSSQKLIALLFLFILMLLMGIWFMHKEDGLWRKKTNVQ
ncbi:MAG: MraY family glycosyltransferase [Candidatus Magasanikbacteria bacterium]